MEQERTTVELFLHFVHNASNTNKFWYELFKKYFSTVALCYYFYLKLLLIFHINSHQIKDKGTDRVKSFLVSLAIFHRKQIKRTFHVTESYRCRVKHRENELNVE